jgi:hypothetical protein
MLWVGGESVFSGTSMFVSPLVTARWFLTVIPFALYAWRWGIGKWKINQMWREVWSDSYDLLNYVDLWTLFVIAGTINDQVRVTEHEKLPHKPRCEIRSCSEFIGWPWRLGDWFFTPSSSCISEVLVATSKRYVIYWTLAQHSCLSF